MSWFGNKINKEMIQTITPTSKASLKSQCLFACNGDMEQADRLYEYFTKDMPDLPMFDAPTPTWVDNTKDTLNGLFSFLGEHKDGLSQGYDIIKAILNARGVNLPSLTEDAEETAEAVESDLPPIE